MLTNNFVAPLARSQDLVAEGARLLLDVLTCGFGLVITGIWAIIDIVLIATGNTKHKFGRPLV